MTPREFLDEVVRPNVAEFNVNFGSLRTAYNAVAAVDALAAHIYWWCKTNSSAEVKGDRDDWWTGHWLFLKRRCAVWAFNT
jgi:hypothetical protein